MKNNFRFNSSNYEKVKIACLIKSLKLIDSNERNKKETRIFKEIRAKSNYIILVILQRFWLKNNTNKVVFL